MVIFNNITSTVCYLNESKSNSTTFYIIVNHILAVVVVDE